MDAKLLILKDMLGIGLSSDLGKLRTFLTDVAEAAQHELQRMDALGEDYVPLVTGSLRDHPEYRALEPLIRERVLVLKALKK
ncbi:hypothetical protein [Myxococcus phage Mx1]|nr:hypothetical protein [Myxococcus phage Mx1]